MPPKMTRCSATGHFALAFMKSNSDEHHHDVQMHARQFCILFALFSSVRFLQNVELCTILRHDRKNMTNKCMQCCCMHPINPIRTLFVEGGKEVWAGRQPYSKISTQ